MTVTERASFPTASSCTASRISRACETEDELRDEVHTTLVHEIAHFYGIDDDRLHELGWA